MRCRNNMKRVAALVLSGLMAAGLAAPAFAAEPQVSVDESVYVTLDYYGKLTETSIVKGCDLNGNYKFTDYGTYTKVTNMSTDDEPELSGDHVTWDLPQDLTRFYFECVPKDMDHALPWTIDVSYSLNGVPAKAEDLAGVTGLVQVDIDVTPNEEAGEYYRHNMMLVALTLVDMEDVNSFRADGAQMQTVGSKKAAIFMATPGEDTTFTYQIGSDSFESSGTIFLMAPITLAQLDQVTKLKDAKERIEDASDALNASLDIILDSLAGLPDGLRQTQEAINTLDRARETIYDAKDGLGTQIDHLNNRLYGMSVTLRSMASDLYQLDDDGFLDDLGSSLMDSGKYVSDVAHSLNAVNNRLSGLKNALDDFIRIPNAPSAEDAAAIKQQVEKALDELEQSLGNAGFDHTTIEQMKENLEKVLNELEQGVPGALDHLEDIKDSISGGLGDLADMSEALSGMVSTGDSLIGEIHETLEDISSSGIVKSTERVVSSTALLMDSLRNTSMYIKETIRDCEDDLNDGLKQLNTGANSIIDTAVNGLNQTGAVKNYKDIIKNTIDDEWDRLSNDLGIMDIDVDADMISFTSARNPVPDSIQIILRTQEITVPDASEEAGDLEASAAQPGMWERIAQIFIKIWNALRGVFE